MKSPRAPNHRLIGTWRSDAALTLAEWTFSPDTTEADRVKIEEYFGKMTLRYTAAKIHSEIEGKRTICPYRIAKDDEDWIMIVRRTGGRDEIQHLRVMQADVYWVSVGRNREYFRRVGD